MARRTKTTAIQVHDIPEAKLSTALREVVNDFLRIIIRIIINIFIFYIG